MSLKRQSEYLHSKYYQQVINDLKREDIDWVGEATVRGIMWYT